VALLEVRDVTVRFGGVTAVDGVSFDVGAGRITGLIGPNGAGKTTLFNVITGLQGASHGRVSLDGEDLAGLPPYQRARRGLARTFQRLELFGLLSVRENLTVAADIRRGWEARRWRARGRRRGPPEGVGEAPMPGETPLETGETPRETAERIIRDVGLAELAEVRTDLLSTGHARLVELGRALATRPRLLLLDEPASGQNDSETARFAALLEQVAAGGVGILLVEHDVRLVMRLCPTIHVLDFGRILASGSPQEIRDDEGVQRAYLGGGVI
jgi:branched-chain amino acid transport system ATP-binding protein